MNRVSLKPSTFTEFAGIDDVDVIILDATFCYFNFSGDNPTFSMTDPGGDDFGLVLAVQMNEEGKEPARPQAYSAGDKEFFRPDPTGAYLVATGTRQTMNDSTNAALFLGSLCNAGFPESNLDTEQGVKTFVGAKVHVNQMARPQKPGKSAVLRTPAPGRKAFDPNKPILLVTRVISLPGQIAATPMIIGAPVNKSTSFAFGQNAPGPASTPAIVPASAAPPSNGAHELALQTLFNILAENNGVIEKKLLPTKAFQALGNNPLKGAVVSLIFDDKFLSTAPGVRYDGVKVQL